MNGDGSFLTGRGGWSDTLPIGQNRVGKGFPGYDDGTGGRDVPYQSDGDHVPSDEKEEGWDWDVFWGGFGKAVTNPVGAAGDLTSAGVGAVASGALAWLMPVAIIGLGAIFLWAGLSAITRAPAQ